MAYDEGLAQRIREHFRDRQDVEEKKMFGGLCFMVGGHMCCGIVKDTLMARVGPEQYESLVSREHASEMNFTGKAMRGMVFVEPDGLRSDSDLVEWIAACTGFVESLPARA